jgi:Na+/H+ antiporter NhaC
MSIEIIVFIVSILFGIVLYWRESKSNKIYRFLNKVFNSKELQMKPDAKKGFIYQQNFLLRVVYIVLIYIIAIIVTRLLIPIDLVTLSLFASSIFGTLAGTYVAHFVIKSGDVIEDKSESLTEIVSEKIEKGKDFIGDITHKDEKPKVELEAPKAAPKKQEKSARERLKDKGYM